MHVTRHSTLIYSVHPANPTLDHPKMPGHNLAEIDSLEATVIIDNELDPLSTIAPDTVHVAGQMATLAKCSPHKVDDRGPACRELKMEDLCCSAHGLSILVVSISFCPSIFLIRLMNESWCYSHGVLRSADGNTSRQRQKAISSVRFFSTLVLKRMLGRGMPSGYVRRFAPWI